MRRELAEKRGRPLPEDLSKPERALKSVPKVDDDLIPDVLGERTEEDLELDSIIESIQILDAYRKWIGKEVNEKEVQKREGLHVSCPNPGHRDKHPSAFINQDKKVWRCEMCDDGGDVFDLAAIKFGYDRPGYKEGKTFHELRKDMAESYGYRFKKVAGTEVIWREEEPVPEGGAADSAPSQSTEETDGSGSSSSEPPPVENKATQAEPSNVTVLREEDVEEVLEEVGYPTLDWRSLATEGTFLHAYMTACSMDDSPEEYHFWHALIALAHSVGRSVYIDDQKDVYANMMVCLLGGTGYGKSRSRIWLEEVLEEAVPFRDNGLDTSGCKLVPVPASGENLLMHFQHIAKDPSLPHMAEIRTPVNGVVDYDEFAALLGRAMRHGNTLKVYVQQFADNKKKVSSSSNTGGTLEAIQPFCSITCSTQPKAVRTLLSKYDTQSGFLNRWVFVGGKRKKREALGGRYSGIKVDLRKAIDELKAVRAWGAAGREVIFTDEGRDAFEDWFYKVIDPMERNDETDLLPRVGLTIKRVLLQLAINERRTTIDADDVKKVKPVLDYLIACYGIVNSEIGISQMSEITTEILRHVKNIQENTKHGASARDLARRMHRKNYSPDLINKALKTMVELDWIDIVKPEKNGPGRPTIRYTAVNQ
jgi:hypothetical protein